MASRGMKWIQHYGEPGLDDDALKEHIALSYKLVSQNLTKKRQRELGLNQD
jgi:predicted DNA-binding protein (MmcQ/YjbR family)